MDAVEMNNLKKYIRIELQKMLSLNRIQGFAELTNSNFMSGNWVAVNRYLNVY